MADKAVLASEGASKVEELAERFAELEKQRANLRGQMEAVKAAMRKLEETCADLEERKKENDDLETAIEDLKAVKQLISKNGLPLQYAKDVFGKVSSKVQDTLAEMGANFIVEPDPERGMTFRFKRLDNEYKMPQESLSGGQAIRLALAQLLASQQLILPEVGLLVLDEPTSHLDAEGVESLRDLFLNLAQVCRNADTQLIVVDHNEALMPAFEKTVRLGGK